MKRYLLFLPALIVALPLPAQKGRPVAAELQLFKDEGAVIVSSDTELVRLVQTYIDFGEIYTPDEVDVKGFKGLFISEFTSRGRTYVDYHQTYNVVTYGSDFYLVVATEPMQPGFRGRSLRESRTSVGVPVSNTLREKLPLFMILLNNLLHLSHRADEDLSVDPLNSSIEHVIGSKAADLKNHTLLIMEHDLGKSYAAKPEKIGIVYPHPYEVSDLYGVLRAVQNREKGKAALFVSASQAFWGVYILRCDTHELLYAWGRRMYGRELGSGDFSAIASMLTRIEK